MGVSSSIEPLVLSPREASFFCRDSRYFQPKVTLSDNSILLPGFYFLFIVFEESFQRPPDSRLVSYSSGFCSQRVLVELEKIIVNVYQEKLLCSRCYIKHFHWLILFNSQSKAMKLQGLFWLHFTDGVIKAKKQYLQIGNHGVGVPAQVI